jgi:peroxiredoxin Q/BCP
MRLLAKCVAGGFMLAALGLVLSTSASVDAKDKVKTKPKVELKVKVGDPAPAFESVDESGKAFKSGDVVGKKIVVLYFYPADFTGGCTKQACGFRDDSKALTGMGAVVLGVSGDSVANHKLFKDDFKLNFGLLADEKGDVAKAFGIPVNAGGKANGKKENGDAIEVIQGVRIARWTVVIGLDGKIAAIDSVSNAAGDSKRIQDLVKKLEKN